MVKKKTFEQVRLTRYMNFLRILIEDPYHFAKFYLILLLLQSLFFVSPNMQSSANMVFIIWGSVIIAYHFFFMKTYFRDRIILVFLFSSLLALATIFLNREAGNLVYSLKTWYLFNFVYLLFYPLSQISRTPKDKMIRGMFTPTVILQFFLSLFSLSLFFFNVAGVIKRHDGGFYWGIRYIFRPSGSINVALFGVYNDSNFASVIAFSSIVFSILLLRQYKRLFARAFLLINILVQAYFIILANSRGVWVGLILFSLFYVGLRLRQLILTKKEKRNRTKAIPLFFLLLVIILGLGDPIRTVSYKSALINPIVRITAAFPDANTDVYPDWEQNDQKVSLSVVKGQLSKDFVGDFTSFFTSEIAPDFTVDEMEPSGWLSHISSQKTDSNDSIEGMGNTRVGRWIESVLMISKYRPFTGTSPRGVVYFAEKYSSQDEIFGRLASGQSPVNSYVTILLYYGWLVFVALMIFFIMGGILIIRKIFSRRAIQTDELLMIALLAFFLVQAFLLSAFLESCRYYSFVLTFAYGYCVDSSREALPFHYKRELNSLEPTTE